MDDSSHVYIAGQTSSTNFPTTTGAYDQTYNGGAFDCFISKISTDGQSLVFSTYIGGSGLDGVDLGTTYSINGYIALAIDSSDDVYITGCTKSSDFPTVNAYDYSIGGSYDCFISEIDSSGSSLLYSTYMGSSGQDYGTAISVDDNNNVYVAGQTTSASFPVVNAYDSTQNGGFDTFILKLAINSNDLIYSTFLGGSGTDAAFAMAVDDYGFVYVAGFTDSGGFPTKRAYEPSYQGGGSDCFVTKLNQSGNTLMYSTFIGAGGDDPAVDLALDTNGTVYVTGWTTSAKFPMVSAYDDTSNGNEDVFVLKLPDNSDSDSDSISDYQEVQLGTNRFSKDSDNDGMDDGWELEYSLNPLDSTDAGLDQDSDNLTNLDEFLYHTSPNNNDTDSDLMPDGWEVFNGLNPTINDAYRDLDGDGLSNLNEFRFNTDPQNPDTDQDGIPDGWEVVHDFNPLNATVPWRENMLWTLPLWGTPIVLGCIIFSLVIYKTAFGKSEKARTIVKNRITGTFRWLWNSFSKLGKIRPTPRTKKPRGGSGSTGRGSSQPSPPKTRPGQVYSPKTSPIPGRKSKKSRRGDGPTIRGSSQPSPNRTQTKPAYRPKTSPAPIFGIPDPIEEVELIILAVDISSSVVSSTTKEGNQFGVQNFMSVIESFITRVQKSDSCDRYRIAPLYFSDNVITEDPLYQNPRYFTIKLPNNLGKTGKSIVNALRDCIDIHERFMLDNTLPDEKFCTVFLFTDGKDDVNNHAAISSAASELKNHYRDWSRQPNLATISIGSNADDALLEEIASELSERQKRHMSHAQVMEFLPNEDKMFISENIKGASCDRISEVLKQFVWVLSRSATA